MAQFINVGDKVRILKKDEYHEKEGTVIALEPHGLSLAIVGFGTDEEVCYHFDDLKECAE